MYCNYCTLCSAVTLCSFFVDTKRIETTMETTHCSSGSFLPSDLALSLLSRYVAALSLSFCLIQLFQCQNFINFYRSPTSRCASSQVHSWTIVHLASSLCVCFSFPIICDACLYQSFIVYCIQLLFSFLWHFCVCLLLHPLITSLSIYLKALFLFQSLYLFSCIIFSPDFLHLLSAVSDLLTAMLISN